jgi:membrane-associated phospholipid phosphatase
MKGFDGLVLGVVVGMMSCGMLGAQETTLPDAPTPQVESGQDLTVQGVPMAVLTDQRAIWTSPARIRTKDLIWLAPLAAATGVAIATDHHTMSTVVSHDARFIAAPVALFAVGHYEQNEKARETGLLGAEALVDAVAVEQGLKLVFWRERPALDNSRGLFYQSGAGWDSSFPSSHATLAWSSAAVIAEEYRSPWVRVGVYALATGVSLTRVMGQEHFPTDVLVGSAAGWLVGHYVARSHHRHRVGRR